MSTDIGSHDGKFDPQKEWNHKQIICKYLFCQYIARLSRQGFSTSPTDLTRLFIAQTEVAMSP